MFSCPLIRFSAIVHDRLVKHEKLLFLLLLLIALFQVWQTRYVPSLDGPQHLYNANVLRELILGNELFRRFFSVNDTLVGYWSGHFFLSLFRMFLPAWLAEKLLLTSTVIGFILSFRFLVRSISPGTGNLVSFLVFPFVYHMYLLLGYYSFSIAAIFFFIAFGLFFIYAERMRGRRLLFFGLAVFMIFLSHALVFVMFCFALAIVWIGTVVHRVVVHEKNLTPGKLAMEAGRIALAVLPALVFWALYIRKVMTVNDAVAGTDAGILELTRDLVKMRLLIAFHVGRELPGTFPVFLLIALLSLLGFAGVVMRIRTGERAIVVLTEKGFLFFYTALFFLVLYYFAPSRISAGSLTQRFALFFFLSMATWLATVSFPKTIRLISLAVILFSLLYGRVIQHEYYRNLNNDISEIRELAEQMEPGSVVTSLQASSNWIHRHFSLYAAVDEPLVHTENPQCWGQFPVVWNREELPFCLAGSRFVIPDQAYARPGIPEPANNNVTASGHTSDSTSISGSEYDHAGQSSPVMQVDYVTIFYDKLFWKDSTHTEWFENLEEHYEEVYVSSGGKASLWGLKPHLKN